MIEVSKLINPEMLVEIEAEAILAKAARNQPRKTGRSKKRSPRPGR